jgi:hypothetical protein
MVGKLVGDKVGDSVGNKVGDLVGLSVVGDAVVGEAVVGDGVGDLVLTHSLSVFINTIVFALLPKVVVLLLNVQLDSVLLIINDLHSMLESHLFLQSSTLKIKYFSPST